MIDLKELIERELDQYLEWPTADKSHVTTVSAKLFAEHVAQLYADHFRDAGKMAAPDVQEESVAWLVTGPYEKVAFAYKETAEKYCAGLNMGYGEEAYKIRELYAAPHPAEQQPIRSDLARNAANHLTNWLEMNICECEGWHSCGYNEVKRTRDALLAAAEQQPAPDVSALVEALERISNMDSMSYHSLESAKIVARKALAAHRNPGGES